MNDRQKLQHASRVIRAEADLLRQECNAEMVVAALLGTAAVTASKGGMTASQFIGMVARLLEESVGVEEGEP